MLPTPRPNTDWPLGTSILTGTRPFTGWFEGRLFFQTPLMRNPVSLGDGFERRTMEVRSESIECSIIMCTNP